MIEHLQKNRSVYCVTFLILWTVIILTNGIANSSFWFSDASRHAMDGIFIHDFIKDLPIRNAYDYLVQYYTKYPALGIGNYPPFFAMVEAVFFAVFGISVVSAKLTVVFFAIIAVVFWYKLIKLIFDEKIAFYSSFLFITTPLIVQWSREAMLEMPALAMIILSTYFFYNFVELNKSRHGYFLIFSSAAAIYTKQTAGFIIPVFFLYIIFTKKKSLFLRKNFIIIVLATLFLILPLVYVTCKYGKSNIIQSVGGIKSQSRLIHLNNWLFYPKTLLSSFTKPVLVLIITYIVLLFFKRKKELQKLTLFLVWILGFYFMFSYIGSKTTRYIYFCIPPFTIFAALLINEIIQWFNRTEFITILLIIFGIYQCFISYNVKTSRVDGYEDAAKYILDQGENTIMFHGSGLGTGNFIFHIRRLDEDRKMVVFRGDKILASSALYPHWSLEEYAKTKEEVANLINSFGSKYFIIEKTAHHNIKVFKMLRNVLKSKDFTLVKKIKIKCNFWRQVDESLLIYKKNKSTALTRDFINMKLPIVGIELSVPLTTLSNFYTPSEVIISYRKFKK